MTTLHTNNAEIIKSVINTNYPVGIRHMVKPLPCITITLDDGAELMYNFGNIEKFTSFKKGEVKFNGKLELTLTNPGGRGTRLCESFTDEELDVLFNEKKPNRDFPGREEMDTQFKEAFEAVMPPLVERSFTA